MGTEMGMDMDMGMGMEMESSYVGELRVKFGQNGLHEPIIIKSFTIISTNQ